MAQELWNVVEERALRGSPAFQGQASIEGRRAAIAEARSAAFRLTVKPLERLLPDFYSPTLPEVSD